MKSCSVCRVEKPIDAFNWRNKSKGWHQPECRECQSARAKAAKARDPVAFNIAVAERKRKWRACGGSKRWYESHRQQEADRKRLSRNGRLQDARANARERYRANPAKQREAQRRWLAKNPDYSADYHRSYAKANRALIFENARRRRAIKRGATIQRFSMKQLDARMSVFGHRCAYCGGPFEHVDHVKPLSRGGPHCLSNLRPSCASCNLHKLAKHPRDWFKVAS